LKGVVIEWGARTWYLWLDAGSDKNVIGVVTAAAVRPSEQEVVDRLPADLKGAYLESKRRVRAFGDDVQTYARRGGTLMFKAPMTFAEIIWMKREAALKFFIRPEGFNIPEKQSKSVHGVMVTRQPDSHLWTLNHRFTVDGSSDLNAVTDLLRQSYDAVKSKA
jgi:hypothetical protein